jgi:hypothetical protein
MLSLSDTHAITFAELGYRQEGKPSTANQNACPHLIGRCQKVNEYLLDQIFFIDVVTP